MLKLRIFLLIALCMASVGFFNGFPRYQIIGEELLANPNLNHGLAFWGGQQNHVFQIPEDQGGGARLVASNGNGLLAIGQTLDSQFTEALLLLRCEMKSTNVVNGIRDWETARVVLISKNRAKQAMYQRPHVLATLSGNHAWQRMEQVFAIDDEVGSLEVAAQLVRSSGEFEVRRFSLRPVLLKTSFVQVRWLLLAAWLLLTLWLLKPLLQASLRSGHHGLVLLLVFAILLGVLTPHDIKAAFAEAVSPGAMQSHAEVVVKQAMDQQYFNLAAELPRLDIFKAGHFLLFALLAMALWLGKAYRLSLGALLGYLLLLATASEVLQLFSPGRSAQLGDIAIDMAGALCGAVLASAGLMLRTIAR